MATIEVRESSDGTKRYRVKVRIHGEKPRTRTFRRKTDAEAWAKAVETDLGRGVYVPTTTDRRRTVAELIDRCIAEHLPSKANNKSAAKVATQLRWWRDELGPLTLDRLTPERVAEARARLRARRSRGGSVITAATTNRYLAALSVATKWGWKELRWLASNPVLEVTKGGEGAGVVRYLSDDERQALLTAAKADPDPNIHTAIVVALATGLRAGSLRALTWGDVDFERRAIALRDSKNTEARWVPLVDEALAALQALLAADPIGAGAVFKSTTRDVPADINGQAWRRVKQTAGLVGVANLRFHDLRHTTGTYLNEAGASAIEIAAALGHKTLHMARRYAHQSPEHTRSVFDRIAGRIAAEPAPQDARASRPGDTKRGNKR